MSDTILDKYVNRAGGPLGDKQDAEPVDDLGCFGILRGVKERAPSLELRKKTGLVLVIGYAWIDSMEFDPSEGLTLSVSGRKVRLKGRNLAAELRPNVRLITALAAHRVAWVQEVDGPATLSEQVTIPLVEAIAW